MVLALALALLGKGQQPRGSILDAPGSVPGGAATAPAPAIPALPSVPTN
jgi:hypothetical protein